MKKERLKHIIRESIKQLVNEQGTGQMVHQYRGYLSSTHGPTTNPGHTPCQASGLARLAFGTHNQVSIPGAVPWGTPNYKYLNNINTYQWFGSPSVGQFVGIQATANYSVTGQTGDIICWEYLGMVPDNNSFQTNNMFNNGLVSTGIFSDCTSCDGNAQPVDGCMDSNAFNYDPNATTQSQLTVCDYGFRCKPNEIKPGLTIGGLCGPGDASNPGNFQTLQDCKESGCEPKPADVDLGDSEFDPTPSPLVRPDDVEIDNKNIRERLQELANIKK